MVSKEQTGKDLVDLFQKTCDEHGKLFIPDSPRQDEIAKSLIRYFDYDELKLAVDIFVRNGDGTVLVFDFALRSRDLIERSKFEEDSKKRFKQIVEQTRLKMEQN